VPSQLAVMGFGDLNFCTHTYPPLTTIKVDGARIGAMSAQAILHRLGGNPSAPSERSIDTGFELIQRGST
jgi:LacI family gluconate utilization system Gnt-I transcriptional repressor